jgi:tetratricopeptide (TPR) repeat protein
MKLPNANTRRAACFGAVFFMASIAGMAIAQQPSLYSQGRQAFAEERYAEAAKLFAASSTAKEHTTQARAADALLMEGKSLVNIDDFAGAERVLKAYLEQNLGSAPALYLLGYVLQRENKPKESLEIFTKAAAIRRPLANDLRIVALDYVLIDDYPDAIRWLNKAVEEDPRNADAWYDLGRSQMNQGNFVAAEKAFDRFCRSCCAT